jgi:hypothetical protein
MCNVPAGWFWARFQISPPLSSSPRSPPILGRWDQHEELPMARVFWTPPTKIPNWWGKCKKIFMKMRMLDMVLSCSIFFGEVTSKMRKSQGTNELIPVKKGRCPLSCSQLWDNHGYQASFTNSAPWVSTWSVAFRDQAATCRVSLEMKNGNSP